MATVTERLAFLISANADQAIRAFEKTAQSAEKELGKAQKNVDALAVSLTKFGAQGLAISGVAATGLFKVGNVAGDLNETISKTNVIFADAASEIIKFGNAAAQQLGMSKQEALDAAGTFALFAKSAGKTGTEVTDFSKQMVTLAADLASFYNTNPEEAIIALGAALRGENEPIRRFNVLITDQILQQEAVKMKIKETTSDALTPQQKVLTAFSQIMQQTSVAQGDFTRTSGGLANQQRILAAEFKNLQASIGEGVLPVLTKLTSGAVDAFSAFNGLPTSLKSGIGTVAAFGTVALGLVSTLSLVAGQAIKMRDRFRDAEGGLNNFGRAAKAASVLIGSLAVVDVVFGAVNEATGNVRNMDAALQELIGTLGVMKGEGTEGLGQATEAFRTLVRQEDSTLRFSNIWADFGKEILITGGKAKRSIEDIDRGFKRLIDEGGVEAGKLLIADWQRLTETLDKSSGQYKDNIMLIERYTDQINRLADAQRGLAAINEQTNRYEGVVSEAWKKQARAALEASKARKTAGSGMSELEKQVEKLRDGLGDKMVAAADKAKEALKKAKDAFDTYRTSVISTITASFSYTGALQSMVSASDRLTAANDRVSNSTKSVADAERSVEDAALAVADARKELSQAQYSRDLDRIVAAERQLAQAQRQATDAQDALTKSTQDLADAQNEQATASAESGKTFIQRLTEQANKATAFSDRVKSLVAAGLDEAGLQQVLSAGAEAGTQIADELLSGADSALKIDKANSLANQVAEAARLAGDAAAGEFYSQGVKNGEQLVAGVDAVVKKYRLRLRSKALSKEQLKRLQKDFKLKVDFEFASNEFEIPDLAEGGIVPATQGGRIVRVAEAGQDEAIIPLSRTGGGVGTTINLVVNAGVGTDAQTVGKELVRILQDYERRNGRVPLKSIR